MEGSHPKSATSSAPQPATLHGLYVISNPAGKTYNGYTIDFERRIRQHNGELVGGAKYTSAQGGPWLYLIRLVCPFLTHRRALSMEWSMKYPTNRRPCPARYRTPQGRIEAMALVLSNPKFADVVEAGLGLCVEPGFLSAIQSLLAPLHLSRVTISAFEAEGRV
jgi:predicted GIY-YIG superfamily endonuclease